MKFFKISFLAGLICLSAVFGGEEKIAKVRRVSAEDEAHFFEQLAAIKPSSMIEAVPNELGRTYYDYATNSIMGRMIARANTGGVFGDGVHFIFMKILPEDAERYVTYDYWDEGGFFFSNGSITETRRTGWGRIVNGTFDEVWGVMHGGGLAYFFDSGEADYSFSDAVFDLGVGGVFPSIDLINNMIVVAGDIGTSNSLAWSEDGGFSFTNGNLSLVFFDPAATDISPAEVYVVINPTNVNEWKYVTSESINFTQGLGKTVIWTSVNRGTWTGELIHDDAIPNPDGSFYNIETFAQLSNMYTSDGAFHVIANGYGIENNGSFMYPVIYWNDISGTWVELTSEFKGHPGRTDPGLATIISDFRSGNGIGNPYPMLSEGPNGELLAVWQQWEDDGNGNAVLISGTLGQQFIATNIWGAFSPDGGSTWSKPFFVAGAPFQSDVFPNIPKTFDRNVSQSTIELDLLYMIDTDPGFSIFGENNFSEAIWVYERVSLPDTFSTNPPPVDDCDFAANLSISDNAGSAAVLTFGTCPGATDGFDAGVDQFAPPPPPPGAFDARFHSSGEDFVKDFRDTNIETTAWEVSFQAAANGVPVMLTWSSGDFPSKGIFRLIDPFTGGTLVNVNMRADSSYSDNLGLGRLEIVYSLATTFSMDVDANWNLIGLPLEPADAYYKSVFPNAEDNTLFGFDQSYFSAESLDVCSGYWIKFPAAETVVVEGIPVDDCDISLVEGWNLISGPSCNVALSTVNDPGGIIIPGTLIGFSGAYFPTSIISTGSGYWLRANAAGSISLSCGAALAKSASAVVATELPVSYQEIIFSDASGARQTLYFDATLEEASDLTHYSLPPRPPAKLLDARFSGDFRLTEAAEPQIQLQGKFPVTVRLGQGAVGQYQLETLTGSQVIGEHFIQAGQEIILTNSQVNALKLTATTGTVPRDFSVSQNYPNPFNPSTEFYYTLPNAEKVTVLIYNALGQKIKTLVSQRQEAGHYTVLWDATNDAGVQVSSGLYFYEVRAGQHKTLNKMVLLR